MPISDYFESMTKRAYTYVSDGQGDFTKTQTDSTISGYLAILSGNELVKMQKLNAEAMAQLDTDETLSIQDRIIYNSYEFEVVFPFISQHNKYYALKLVS
jgi:hypothetical protein